MSPRATLLAIATLAAAVHDAAAERAGSELAPQSGVAAPALEDVLPKRSGKSVCYAMSSPDGVVMTAEDWSEAAVTFVPVPGLFQDGKQATRPQPKLYPDAKVTALALSITADDRSPTEPYRFSLSAAIGGWKRVLRATGSCAFFRRDKDLNPGPATDGTWGFSCYVECDGGSVGVSRASGVVGLAVRFDRESGLRMTAGCSEETSSVRLKAVRDEQAFVLTSAPARTCRPPRGHR
jgi:hypothetical protein